MGRRVGGGLLGLVFAGGGASCSDGDRPPNICNCPDRPIPEIAVELPCGQQAAQVTPSGPCRQVEGGDAGTVSLWGTGAGTCNVKVTFSDGTDMTTSVTIDGQWMPCGDDPHGCGQRLGIRGAERPGPFVVGQACSN